MTPQPFLGVLLHAVGGLAAASFYIPYKKVKRWAWETYWLAGGFFSWIIAPIAFVLIIAPHALAAVRGVPATTLFWTYFFGVLWGIGGLTFGLSMRYLGIALGYAIALGFCAAFGTLMPPIFDGQIGQVLFTHSGQVVLLGVGVCLVGIAISGAAGVSKERELPAEDKQASIAEFSFGKGLLVAIFAGVMSASMAYGLNAGKPIGELAVKMGTPDVWQNLPVLVVVLLGGFTTNFLWCLILNFRNRTVGEYFGVAAPADAAETEADALGVVGGGLGGDGLGEGDRSGGPEAQTGVARTLAARARRLPMPLAANYLLCALAGTTWYLQFFFYGMGTTKMGKFNFSSWTLHMASIIIFSTLWGIALREWKGTSRRTHLLITLGLAVLIGSTLVVGYGNYLAAVH